MPQPSRPGLRIREPCSAVPTHPCPSKPHPSARPAPSPFDFRVSPAPLPPRLTSLADGQGTTLVGTRPPRWPRLASRSLPTRAPPLKQESCWLPCSGMATCSLQHRAVAGAQYLPLAGQAGSRGSSRCLHSLSVEQGHYLPHVEAHVMIFDGCQLSNHIPSLRNTGVNP